MKKELYVPYLITDSFFFKKKQPDDENLDWCPYEDLPELSKQKLIGVRLLVNYLTACKEEAEPEEYIVHRIFSILWDLLERSSDAAMADGTW